MEFAPRTKSRTRCKPYACVPFNHGSFDPRSSSTREAAAVAEKPRLLAPSGPWLFSRSGDLFVFAGPALLAFALVAYAASSGLLVGDAPAWTFFAIVLAVDVAHVWSTLFRVYFDGAEFERKRALYVGAPIAVYVAGVMLHAVSSLAFWRVLAYVAVFHFMRQQVGWMRLYDRRDAEAKPWQRRLDSWTIYACCLYPLLWWHAHLPRAFDWFLEGDFVVGLSSSLLPPAALIYGLTLAAFAATHALRVFRGQGQPGKIVLAIATAACWYGGIVAFDSDLVFTVTNVLLHGVPYFLLTFRYGRKRAAEGAPLLRRLLGGAAVRAGFVFAAIVLVLATVEEGIWDRYVWHEHAGVFGNGASLGDLTLALLVPLLSLPQAVHYVLDGVVWRGASNPLLR